MSAVSQGLVPTLRDFEVYQEIVVHERTMRSVAWDYEISASRVSQVVEKVRAFLKGKAPQGKTKEEQERELYVAQQIASARINNLFGQCERQWEASIDRMILTEHATKGDGPTAFTQTRRHSLGEIKYLWQAVRVAERAMKLPLCDLSMYALAAESAEAKDVEGREEPPVGGFAPDDAPEDVAAMERDQAAAANPVAHETCEESLPHDAERNSPEVASEQNDESPGLFPEYSPLDTLSAGMAGPVNGKQLKNQKRKQRHEFLQQRLAEFRRQRQVS